MKRLKSAFATVLLVSAGAAAIGLGVVMAAAALLVGLALAGAARLSMNAEADDASRAPEDAEFVNVEPSPAA